MLTREENERFTRVRPGTPAGEMLRRYWWPVAFGDLVQARPSRVKVLDEEILLFRDGSGRVGAVEPGCAHRGLSLEYGRVEACGIRCAYHGWLYDVEGRCLEQPAEPEGSSFKDRVQLRSYPTQELAGLIFTYLGPEPAPLLPKYDMLYRQDGVRTLWGWIGHSNWLQHAENTVDQAHLFWLHASQYPQWAAKRPRIEYERTAYGVKGTTYIPGVPRPKVSCTIFPSANRITNARVQNTGYHTVPGARQNLIYRTPIDDTHTLWLFLVFTPTEDGTLVQQTHGLRPTAPGTYQRDEGDGWWEIATDDQDRMALEAQGLVVNRDREHLVATDRGVILLREILRESIQAVAEGRDPFGVIRDPAEHTLITFDASMDELAALV